VVPNRWKALNTYITQSNSATSQPPMSTIAVREMMTPMIPMISTRFCSDMQGHREVIEDHQKDKDVVHRKRLLYQVASEERRCMHISLLSVARRAPDREPEVPATDRPVTAMGAPPPQPA
jgi:hypothetical protein